MMMDDPFPAIPAHDVEFKKALKRAWLSVAFGAFTVPLYVEPFDMPENENSAQMM